MSNQRGQPKLERFTVFVLALLRERRANEGWVLPDALAVEAGVSRATVYRWLRIVERELPIEFDAHTPTIRSRGVRCAFVAKRREDVHYRTPVADSLSSGELPC